MSVMDESIQNCVGDRRFADDFMPVFHIELTR